MPIDIVLLMLHGAMVAQCYEHCGFPPMVASISLANREVSGFWVIPRSRAERAS